MICRMSLLLLLVVTALGSSDKQRTDAVAFDIHWDVYIRDLFGCERTGDLNPETCKEHRALVNRREFHKAREAAKSLFDLREP